MRVTQQFKYSVYGIFDLAYHGSERPVCVQEIGARQGIPARYLEQIFQKLRRAGLVESKRGPGGGYVLARSPQEISLADIAIAVEGDLLCGVEPITNGADRGDHDREGSALFALFWARVREGIEQAFAAHTVAGLCREAAEQGVERVGAPPPMYHI